MKLRNTGLALAALAMAAGLGGCATLNPGGGPGAVAQATVLDEKVALGVELAYKAARLAAETAGRAGYLNGPRASAVAALDSKAYAAVRAVRAAYAAGQAADYISAAAQAQAAVSAMLTELAK